MMQNDDTYVVVRVSGKSDTQIFVVVLDKVLLFSLHIR